MRAFKEFSQTIQSDERLEGAVTVETNSRLGDSALSGAQEADRFVISLGFQPLADRWTYLSENDALELLQDCLQSSLAYGCKMFSTNEALTTAKDFLSFFKNGETEYLANGDRHGWNPITKSTFETAIIILDHENIGLFLFEDED